ncbi:MAG: hypothetical protein JXQ75_03005 [Phycisphaerae bacterium]|nr:hypothetical protein [Phycisphaerae bacterium]
MRKGRLSLALGLLLAVSACDETSLSQIAGLLEDPLGTQPYPVIIGGDDAQVFYATNLGDITFRFPGLTYDTVLPGFLGPSNVYQFTKKKPELIRALVPAGPTDPTAMTKVVTDGRYVAYACSLSQAPLFKNDILVVEDLWLFGPLNPRVVFDREGRDDLDFGSDMVLDSGRLVFAVRDDTNHVSQIHVEDLTGADPTREIEVGEFVWSLALRGNLLVHTENNEGQHRVVLRDLATDEVTLLADDARFLASDVFLTANSVVWAESVYSSETSRVMAWDVPTATRSVWSDSVLGELAGATDDFLLTQEQIAYGPPIVNPDNKADMIIVRRYDRDGKSRKLAEFRWTGLSGQAQVIGNRAAWVKPNRKIVLAPLDGGDRTTFKPF